MEPGQESAASAIDDTNVPSNSEELVPNPAMSTKCSHEIFSGVSFCLCDDVKDIDEIKKLLTDGGGKLVNYLSDIVSHVIADNPNHPDVTEAVEIYEKPVVTAKWVRMSWESGALLPVGAFNPSLNQLFSKVTVSVSNLSYTDVESLWAMVTFYGGRLKLQLDSTCTHLLTTKPEGEKYEKANNLINVVTPDWVVDCIKNKQLCDEGIYHPKLLVTFCTRPRKPMESMEIPPRVPVPGHQIGSRCFTPQSPNCRQIRPPQLSLARTVQTPKPSVRVPGVQSGQKSAQLLQFNATDQNQNWSSPQQGPQYLISRPPNSMDNLNRMELNPQQMQISPRNQVFLSLQQQPEVRSQQQLNFVQVRQMAPQPQQQQQPQYQHMQTQSQPSQKPPNVILQQRIQPPVHTLSLSQQQPPTPQHNMMISGSQNPSQAQPYQYQQQPQLVQPQHMQHQHQQMMVMQRHPDMGQQVQRQHFSSRTGFVGQPRVMRVPQMPMSQISSATPVRGTAPCGPQPMMAQYSQDPQRMILRQPMEMQNPNVIMRHPMQQNMVPRNQWNEQIPPQMIRGQTVLPARQNFAVQNYNQVVWSSQPNSQPAPLSSPVTSHEGQRPQKSSRSGEKRSHSSHSSSPKSAGTLSSVSSASSITCSMGSPSTNSALVTSKTKTALANLLNNRLQNSGPITSTLSSRNCHDPPFPGNAINCTGSSSSSTSTLTPMATSVSLSVTASSSQCGDGSSAIISCCPLSPSNNRLVCVGSPGVILPTGEILHRGLVDVTPVQERFVGHDQSLTIPEDLCLVGCTFFISGYEKEGPFVLSGRQRELMKSRIRRSGGQVEPAYSSKVTHVMCDMQDVPGADQAIRDGKRLVTVYWLDAVLKEEKKVRPPWRVIHLPRSPRYIPVSDEIISSSGFSIKERQLIREICIQIGALYTPHFSTKNTVLVCKKLEGEKYSKAEEWCIPVVNVQWLNDIALGVDDVMKKPYGINQKYRTFDMKDPFDLADFQSIRNVMAGWVNPIHVTEEELNEAIENKNQSNSELSVEISLTLENKEESKKLDDDVFAKPSVKKVRVSENIGPDASKKSEDTPLLPPPPPLTLAPFATVPFKVMITGCDSVKEKARLEAIVKRMGAKCLTMASKYTECTHLIADNAVRTVKFLCAMNYATNIVKKSWLFQSEQTNSFVSESGHELEETKAAIIKRKERGGKTLLDKKVIYITPGCIPSPSILSDIATSAGGVGVTSRGPTANQMQRMKEGGLDFIILTKKETDLHLIDKYLLANVPCLAPEWLISSVMAQDLRPYTDFEVQKD